MSIKDNLMEIAKNTNLTLPKLAFPIRTFIIEKIEININFGKKE